MFVKDNLPNNIKKSFGAIKPKDKTGNPKLAKDTYAWGRAGEP